jgi:predicted transposase YdaD
MLKETSIVQDWLTQSQQEGWQKGQKEGKFSLLQIILAQKSGTILPHLSNKLHQLSSEQLDRLGVALLNINSQQELQAWLSNGAAQESH